MSDPFEYGAIGFRLLSCLDGGRVAGACTTGRGEFGCLARRIRRRRAASAPSPKGKAGNRGQDLRAEK